MLLRKRVERKGKQRPHQRDHHGMPGVLEIAQQAPLDADHPDYLMRRVENTAYKLSTPSKIRKNADTHTPTTFIHAGMAPC